MLKEQLRVMELEWLEKEEKALTHIENEIAREQCRKAYSKQRMILRDVIEQQYGLPGIINYKQ